jgi:hypothetical protein
MFRPSDPQRKIFDAGGLLSPEQRAECERSWAGPFRQKCLPLLRGIEESFADLFDPKMGRPNRPVALVVGTLILKEMKDLTDEEAVEALKFDARWWYAFELEPKDERLCPKTLYNFRQGLLEHQDKEKKKLAFRQVTDRLIEALGVKVERQRLDSKHIVSNIAILTRLGLFCETIRVFLREVKRLDPKAYETVGAGILKRHGEESRYADARKAEGPRRLGVVARDVGRLVDRFEDDPAVTSTEGWKLLWRLYQEQCDPTMDPEEPGKDDDDHGEGGVCVALKEAKEVSPDSLQSPHDPTVTYSGHKGKGFEVQVVETCVDENPVQMITDVEVTASSGCDQEALVPMVKGVIQAGHKPKEVATDTGYSGAKNAAELAKEGVNLLAPAPAVAKPEPGKEYAPAAPQCPKEEKEAGEWLRRQEASPDFAKRYAIRAGSEATNSELARAHGMGKLRVRGKARVKLSVYFKALACNVKRALGYWLLKSNPMEGAACLA